MITGTTKLLGVIGHPIAHSLSPVMHNAAIAHLGLDFVYLPLPVPPDRLAQAIEGFDAIDLQGFSVTIPHKQAIMPLLQEISPTAKTIGAVNTVARTDRGWFGTNTDAIGFLAPLRELNRSWRRAVILGNGGAARAVVAGCQTLGCAEIQVVGRDRSKLDAFRTSWPENLPLTVHAWFDLPTLLPQADLLVNTTPIGMHPNSDRSPLEALDRLSDTAIVYDLIYTPRPTLLLQQAQARGLRAIDGLEMLVQQGAAALELWIKQPVPVEVMRQALEAALAKH
ncbi:shikimate dehydrogenase [Microcoleus sp. FACHB-1515]|uniref:shikimate dehydrogenase n=1 Tax=Cyanophyceae TaxID=3028117 RepID=UPI001687C8E9|nr:shikimate dehydrogenase [Microcoleus sp. FACHB-1515]MBD2091792.1 shikimate dehydrogenase [Microcoleus sp. FACHB-1515]